MVITEFVGENILSADQCAANTCEEVSAVAIAAATDMVDDYKYHFIATSVSTFNGK